MVAKRVIPCLDVMGGKTVKGINFIGLKEVGNPVELAKKYSSEGADELVLLDISATVEGRSTFIDVVRSVAKNINIPFAVGGGISSIYDAEALFRAGADKITINSSAVREPKLITEIASKFGQQAVVVAIDAVSDNNKWIVTTHGGRVHTDKELFSWALQAEEMGAGEILFTSMNHDGTKRGYACSIYKKLSRLLAIPVIASGGAGEMSHFKDVLQDGVADAALAASLFHYDEITIKSLKEYLSINNIKVRL